MTSGETWTRAYSAGHEDGYALSAETEAARMILGCLGTTFALVEAFECGVLHSLDSGYGQRAKISSRGKARLGEFLGGA